MDVVQQLPSEASASGDLARAIARLLGPAYQPGNGTVAAALFLALGDILKDTRAINVDAINEAFASSANQLLTRYETVYGIVSNPSLTIAQREQRIVAKIQALRPGTPQDIAAAVNNLLSGGNCTIFENEWTAVLSDPNGVYVWALTIAASDWNNTATLAAVNALVQQMKPAHTLGSVAVNADFLTDDSNSLTNRDVLGA